MEALQEIPVTAERQTIYNRIMGFTPGWQEARDRARRDDNMNGQFNLQEKDAFAPINRLLEQLIDLRLQPEDYGE